MDTIESAVKKIEGSLGKLEERTTRLEALEKTDREDIDNLKTNHSLIDKKQRSKIKALDEKIAKLQDKEKEINQVLEGYLRRENIKFNNIVESPWP